jgi:hypothetical protein
MSYDVLSRVEETLALPRTRWPVGLAAAPVTGRTARRTRRHADFPWELPWSTHPGHVLESTSLDSMKKSGGVPRGDRQVAIKGVTDWSLPD